jgi:DNA-binding LacI/PurR family transcriptional regulator
VGILTQDPLELFAEQWLGSVEGARDAECDLICFCGRALDTPGYRSRANAIYDVVSDATLDGLVVWTSVIGINIGAERLAEYCQRFAPLPMVSVEQPLGDSPLVVTDNRLGMYSVVSHLIEVHGRTRLAFLPARPTTTAPRCVTRASVTRWPTTACPNAPNWCPNRPSTGCPRAQPRQ